VNVCKDVMDATACMFGGGDVLMGGGGDVLMDGVADSVDVQVPGVMLMCRWWLM
jgi:hypothetical protein